MNILHVAPIRWDRFSGLRWCIPSLAAAQNALEGVRTALWISVKNTEQPSGDIEIPVWQNRVMRTVGGDRLDLPEPWSRADLVVFHSTYIPCHAAIGRMLRRLEIPYIVCPHSGLTQFAQSRPRLKKWLGNRLFFRRLVVGARAIHFLTDVEYQESVAWGRPSFVVGNGTDLPPRPDRIHRMDESQRPLRLVFVGRLHVQYKGLDLLVDAIARIAAKLRHRRATIEIYGPDIGGSQKWLAERIARAGIGDLAALPGPICGVEKADLLARSDVFLHTSRNEGHPIAVLEALAHGLPCLLTPATTMAETVESAGAGWRTLPGSDAIAATLDRVIRTSPDEFDAMRRAARNLAESEFQWSVVARRTIEAYRRFVPIDQRRAA